MLSCKGRGGARKKKKGDRPFGGVAVDYFELQRGDDCVLRGGLERPSLVSEQYFWCTLDASICGTTVVEQVRVIYCTSTTSNPSSFRNNIVAGFLTLVAGGVSHCS